MERSHHADPGEHRRAVMCCNQQQRLHRGLPFFGIVFCLRQFRDVLRGVTECDQRFPAWQRDWFVKLRFLTNSNPTEPGFRCETLDRFLSRKPRLAVDAKPEVEGSTQGSGTADENSISRPCSHIRIQYCFAPKSPPQAGSTTLQNRDDALNAICFNAFDAGPVNARFL